MPLWVEADATSTSRHAPLLVVIFLRGGADGLHLVPPVGDPDYARARESLTLEAVSSLPEGFPGAGDFALHPALEAIRPLALGGELAIVHAVGAPDATRSHFSAQDRMEAGASDLRRPGDGWLARGLAKRATLANPFASLALAGSLPLSLNGSGAFAMSAPESFGVAGASRQARRALRDLYGRAAHEDPARSAGDAALRALDAFESRLGPNLGLGRSNESTRQHRRRWLRGARGRSGTALTRGAENIARLVAAGVPVRAVCLDSGGWDTHRNQGLGSGSFATRARDLGDALSKLAEIGRARDDWLVVVMTEFGRTVHPNGSGGSDHGHGSAMLVAGNRVRPGVHGDWPGLSKSALYEGRDLAIRTDYRSVLSEVLAGHLGDAPVPSTFPGFAPRPLGLIG